MPGRRLRSHPSARPRRRSRSAWSCSRWWCCCCRPNCRRRESWLPPRRRRRWARTGFGEVSCPGFSFQVMLCRRGNSRLCVGAAGVRWPEPVGDVRVLALQPQAGGTCLELDERREVLVAVAVADHGLHDLVHQRGNGKRHLLFARRGETEVEVLAQQRGGEGGVEVEVDEGRCLVAGE